jgi:hypothetical protein
MNTRHLRKLLLIALLLAALLGVTAVMAQRPTASLGEAKLVFGQPYVPANTEKAQAVQTDSSKLVPSVSEQRPMSASVENNKPTLPVAAPRGRILYETFEGIWPVGLWATYDPLGSVNGEYCWDDENWIAFQGSWSGWPAGGCADGLDPNIDFYANNMDSWAVYGPFSLSNKSQARLNFKYWNQSEEGFDFFYWCASPDGLTYYCKSHTGDSNGWQTGSLNLKNVPGYGSLLADSSVWIGFVFRTDGSIVDDGPFIDNVRLSVKQ